MESLLLISECIIHGCKNQLTDYETKKQIKHPHTRKFRMCRKHRWERNFHPQKIDCVVCGAVINGILRKYCPDCLKQMQKLQAGVNYEKQHPKKFCKVCGQMLGRYRHDYCSDECWYIQRKKTNREYMRVWARNKRLNKRKTIPKQ